MKIIFVSLVALAVATSLVVSQEDQQQNEDQATKLTVDDGKIDEIEQKVPKKIEPQIRHKTKKYHKDASSYDDSLKVEPSSKSSSKPSNAKDVDFRSPKEPKFVIMPEVDDVLDTEFTIDESQTKNTSESKQLDTEKIEKNEKGSFKSVTKQESKSQKSSEDQKSLKKNKANKNKKDSHTENQEKHSRSGRTRRDSSATKKSASSSSKNSPSKAGNRRQGSDSKKIGTKRKSDKKRRK